MELKQHAVETTATRPEMKVLDFDASTAEYAQFVYCDA